MTLVELMIAITIMALAATGTVYSVNALTRTKLRASAMRICAAARFARHRALTHGTTVRVVLDLDNGHLGIEESASRVALTRQDRDTDEDEPEAVDPWESAQQIMAHPDEPTLGASAFAVVTDEDGDPIERYMEQPLDGNVQFTRFISPHEPEPREHGRVAFYYFPNGTGEHVLVELMDPRDNKLTVEIDPLAARGRVLSGRVEARRIMDRQPRDPR